MNPGIEISDPGTAYWVEQAILRLRREVAWHRRLHSESLGTDLTSLVSEDPVQSALDLLRHHKARTAFFASDPAGSFLSARLAALRTPEPNAAPGSWAWLEAEAALLPAEAFVLGLALAGRMDAAVGPVCAACQNDASRPFPTLALAQQLWSDPLAVLAAADMNRPLRRFGLLTGSDGDLAMAGPLEPATWLARWLTGTTDPEDFGLIPLPPTRAAPDLCAVGHRLGPTPQALEVVPVPGPPDADGPGLIAQLSAFSERPCLATLARAALSLDPALRVAWMAGADLAISWTLEEDKDVQRLTDALVRAADLKLRVYVRLADSDLIKSLAGLRLGPIVPIPPTDHSARLAQLGSGLGARAKDLRGEITQVAQDYRMEPAAIDRVVAGLRHRRGKLTPGDLAAACRAECHIDFRGLAEPVAPRFGQDDIVLPQAVRRHFDEVIAAVAHAGRVHYDWGAAEAMADGGVALLFAGVPGTGKSMAVEVIARTLALPLYRIDLSQVVNKYIGETEKNLKRVFDTAERLRCILFFDEADALFGKRTEVKDANDRFANIETGYLLQRMERFKGVAILATNRRKDLDEAFSRRLRYVIEFPVPGPEERAGIWHRVFPPKVNLEALDIPFLARQFQLSGGHIRSIAFNASLAAAARGKQPRVTMRDVLVATKRELDKLNRTAGPELFGAYHAEFEELRG